LVRQNPPEKRDFNLEFQFCRPSLLSILGETPRSQAMPKTSTPLLILLLAGVLFVASGQAPTKTHGVLSVLHAGQPVNLADTDGGYKLNLFDGGPEVLGHKVVEIGSDFVVVEDITGIQQLRIPVYSIKSVATTKPSVGK
jgi:hypothetical protein